MFSTSSEQTCVCGHFFDSAGALTRHKKNCQRGKKRLADALRQAREVYQAKRRRLQDRDLSNDGNPSTSEVLGSNMPEATTIHAIEGAQSILSGSDNGSVFTVDQMYH